MKKFLEKYWLWIIVCIPFAAIAYLFYRGIVAVNKALGTAQTTLDKTALVLASPAISLWNFIFPAKTTTTTTTYTSQDGTTTYQSDGGFRYDSGNGTVLQVTPNATAPGAGNNLNNGPQYGQNAVNGVIDGGGNYINGIN